MNEYFIIVGAKFENNDIEYVFKCFDLNVQVGSLVVVDTKFGFRVVTVTSTNPDHSRVPLGEMREVVQIVDTMEFENRRAKKERIETLKKIMDEKVKELQEAALYEMLAEKDPMLKNAFLEYKSLIDYSGGQNE